MDTGLFEGVKKIFKSSDVCLYRKFIVRTRCVFLFNATFQPVSFVLQSLNKGHVYRSLITNCNTYSQAIAISTGDPLPQKQIHGAFYNDNFCL